MAQCEQCGADAQESARYCRQCGSSLAAADPLIGQEVLGRYRIVRLIGEGGMGRVYEGEQRVGTTTRRVAVKTLRPQLSADPQLARRFFREAETIVRLTHPNTIQFFDFGELPNGTLAMVMEFIEGHTLSLELTRGVLAPERAERILAQICGALAEAHSLGIVHRDLKPDNVLLTTRAGQRDFVKVLDFGIAKISSDEDRNTKLTQQGMMVGTPPYMSPEQFSGDAIDTRSDIYSLGVIAYEMLTGRLPFEARTPWEWASKHLTAEPAPIRVAAQPGLSERRVNAIRRALSKRPEQRPANVEELLAEFTEPLGTGSQPRPAPHPVGQVANGSGNLHVPAQETPARQESVVLPMRRFSSPLKVAAAVLVGLIGGGALLLSASQPSAAPSVSASAVTAPPTLPHPPVEAPASAVVPEIAPESASAPLAERSRSSDPSRKKRPTGTESQPARASAALVPGAPASAPPAPTSVGPSPATTGSDTRAAGRRPESAPRAEDPAQADLRARVEKGLAAAPERVEVAVGLYRAASARYGEEQPLLAPLRRAIAENGEKRVHELLAAGRCAQAQAIYGALASIGAANTARRLFGSRCPAP